MRFVTTNVLKFPNVLVFYTKRKQLGSKVTKLFAYNTNLSNKILHGKESTCVIFCFQITILREENFKTAYMPT